MLGLVRWHVGLGALGLRQFLLPLLWVLGSLVGAIALGLFPATAALPAVLRQDQLDNARESEGLDVSPRCTLWRDFWVRWRAECGRANHLGMVLVAGWLVIMLDRWILTGQDLEPATPWGSGRSFLIWRSGVLPVR